MKFKLVLLFAMYNLFFSACDWKGLETDHKAFYHELQGRWITNNPDTVYSGALVITNDRITITGYGESQTPFPWGNDAERPFRSYTKGVALKGY